MTGRILKTHNMFAPSRVRGLKHHTINAVSSGISVRTFTGAWIETQCRALDGQEFDVRTFTGAWIETR